MSNYRPDALEFRRLMAQIRAEEQRTRQRAEVVRISRDLAAGLLEMQEIDWYAACMEHGDAEFCARVAADFVEDGIQAVNGLALPGNGPVLELADEPDAPNVEIIVGTAWAPLASAKVS